LSIADHSGKGVLEVPLCGRVVAWNPRPAEDVAVLDQGQLDASPADTLADDTPGFTISLPMLVGGAVGLVLVTTLISAIFKNAVENIRTIP